MCKELGTKRRKPRITYCCDGTAQRKEGEDSKIVDCSKCEKTKLKKRKGKEKASKCVSNR